MIAPPTGTNTTSHPSWLPAGETNTVEKRHPRFQERGSNGERPGCLPKIV